MPRLFAVDRAFTPNPVAAVLFYHYRINDSLFTLADFITKIYCNSSHDNYKGLAGGAIATDLRGFAT